MKDFAVSSRNAHGTGFKIGILGALIGAFAGVSLLSPIAMAGGTPDIVFQSESKLWLEGDSTLHPYSSKTRKLKIEARFAPGGGGDKTGPEAVKELIKAGKLVDLSVSIPVESLKSGESLLDSNMYKALNSDKYPNIKFDMSSYKVKGTDSDLTIVATGKLTIAGKSKDVELTADGSISGDTIRVKGKEVLNMSEYGVKPPELMFGTIKVKDKVTVHYDLVGQLK